MRLPSAGVGSKGSGSKVAAALEAFGAADAAARDVVRQHGAPADSGSGRGKLIHRAVRGKPLPPWRGLLLDQLSVAV